MHTVEVYVGTGGDHQDEFHRGERPKDLIRNSIVTSSLGAAVLNGKYVLALPLNRIEQEFQRNGFRVFRTCVGTHEDASPGITGRAGR